MNLLEFITYCNLKGIVHQHKEIVPLFPSVVPMKYYRLQIQARGYGALVEYGRFEDWTRITKAVLNDYVPVIKTKTDVALDEIIEKIMPNFNNELS